MPARGYRIDVWRNASTGLYYAACDACGWVSRRYRDDQRAQDQVDRHAATCACGGRRGALR